MKLADLQKTAFFIDTDGPVCYYWAQDKKAGGCKIYRSCQRHYWFELSMFLLRKQLEGDVAEFLREHPIAGSDEILRRDIDRIENYILPAVARIFCPAVLLEGCLAGNMELLILGIEKEKDMMLGIVSWELLCGSIEKVCV